MNKKKFLAVTLATAMAFPTLTSFSEVPYNAFSEHAYAQTTQSQVKSPFKDISSDYAYFNIITEMHKQGIIKGYPDGTFKPNQTLSRQHAAVLIVRAMKVNGIELEKVREFVQPKDLTTKNPYYQEIKLLMEAGLLDTDKNGNINPSKPLTRGDMAKILTKVFDLKVKADYVFEDVKGTGYEEYIKALYSNGVTTGFENYTYRVNESLTRAHYAVFVYRAMNLDPNFEAKPIPAPSPKPSNPTPTPSTPSTGDVKVKYSDWSWKDVKTKIPRPAGYVAGEHEKQNEKKLNELKAKNGYGFGKSMSISESLHDGSVISFEEELRILADALDVSYEDFVKAINYCIDTGKLYEGKTFSMYFDYQKGHIVISGIRNY